MSQQELHNITTVINALVSIKWSLICIAVSLWGITGYFFTKEFSKWWESFDKKKNEKKPFNLDQMNKDLEASTRPRKIPWDG